MFGLRNKCDFSAVIQGRITSSGGYICILRCLALLSTDYYVYVTLSVTPHFNALV